MDTVRDEDVKLIKAFGRGWIAGDVMRQPIQMDSKFVAAPGESYPDGKMRWQKGEVAVTGATPK